MSRLTSDRITELQAQNLPTLRWSDVFTVSEGSQDLTDEQKAALDSYLSQFVNLPKDDEGRVICLGCATPFADGLMGLLGGLIDATSWEWSIAHGECHCRMCGYPGRAYHYDIGGKGDDAVIKRLNLTLAVHPSQLIAVGR